MLRPEPDDSDPAHHPFNQKPRAGFFMTTLGPLPGKLMRTLQKVKASLLSASTFMDWLPPAAPVHPMPALEPDRRQETQRHRIRSLAGLWQPPKPGQDSGKGVSAQSKLITRPSPSSVDPERLAGPQVQRPPANRSYRGNVLQWHQPPDALSWTVRVTQRHGHWRRDAPKAMR